MSSEEYLDSLLQSIEENAVKEKGSPLIKKIFTDVDDYEKKEEMSSFADAKIIPEELQFSFDDDALPSGNDILTDIDALPSGNDILSDIAALPSENPILTDAEMFEDEDWKISLDELLAAADESGIVAEADLDKVSVDEMDVTQLIDSMSELDDSLVEINELLKKSDNNETIEADDDMLALLNSISEGNAENGFADDTNIDDVSSQQEENTETPKKRKSFFGKKNKEEKASLPKKQKKIKKKKVIEEAQNVAQDDIWNNISDETQDETVNPTWDDTQDITAEIIEKINDSDISEMDSILDDVLGNKEEPAKKNQGFLRRLFEALTAEDEEETQEGLSENDEILKELESEDKEKADKKGKKKKEKKDKKEKAAQKEAKQDEKKKPKKEKPQKDSIEQEIGKSRKVLSRKGLITLIAFCTSLISIIVAFAFFLTDYADKQKARQAFYMGDYQEAYVLLYDKTLNDSDALILGRVRVILELERNMEVYEFYVKTEKEALAMNALLEGVQNYEEISEVNDFGSGRELTEIYQDILQILEEKYGITEEEAREINTYGAEEYTQKVYAIVNGTHDGSDSGNEQEQPQSVEDILPEEEGIIALETENEGA